jgi:uncharacterized protein RhaS with RHS repeats
MKAAKLEWRILSDEEVAEHDRLWRYGPDLEGEAWRALFVNRCPGHDWYLHIDPDDGTWLHCRKCPAGVDDLCPDGQDLLTGEFEVYPGYVLGLRYGSVEVNGTDRGGWFTYGWRGPVTVDLHVEKYTSMDWIGTEYDVWIEVGKRDS